MIPVLLYLFAAAALALAQSPLDPYNVVWTSPSKDSSGSMPLGNGDIGVNVWVEESGDILFYIGKTDAWSETARLLKLGRVRVRLSPSPFTGEGFRQTLRLATGDIVIRGGKPGAESTVTLWVDANNPAIRIEADSNRPTEMQVTYERWRAQQRVLEGDEAHSAYGLEGSGQPIVSYGDSIQLDAPNSVIWYHRNTKSSWSSIMRAQGLADLFPMLRDPLQDRTFGASISGEGLTRINPTTLKSAAPGTRHTASIFALTTLGPSSEEWVRELQSLATRSESLKLAEHRSNHEKNWQRFWDRSYIRVEGQSTINSGYVLQRFLNACGGKGAYPIKFNGSIFTVDAKVNDQSFDADFRRWGGPYGFQNTRLIYWPMLAAGDFELMQPFFNMYKEAVLLSLRRTPIYFKHEGMFFPENMYFWGAYPPSDYGWKRDGKPVSWVENAYIRNHFSSGLELLTMLLEYQAHTQDKGGVRELLEMVAEGVLTFYDKHYERDQQGRLRLEPAQALETWHEAVNPMPDIAGLKYVLTSLLASKAPVDKQTQTLARKLLSQLPPLPIREVGASTLLAPAERVFGESKNTENPELYAVFPYRLFGVDKPDLEMARATFAARKNQGAKGWSQDAIQAAYLGLNQQAAALVGKGFTPATDSRFPAFWGPNFDWTPDQTQGNAASMALQAMLIQSEGNKIYLLPAWPKEWDVEFKLHAPQGTIVEGAYKGGKLERLKVTPEKRAQDVVKPDPS